MNEPSKNVLTLTDKEFLNQIIKSEVFPTLKEINPIQDGDIQRVMMSRCPVGTHTS